MKNNYLKLAPEVYSSKSFKNQKTQFHKDTMILVSEQDIIDTYSKDEQFSCKKYAEYLKLMKENPSFGYKRCAKILGVPQGRTRWRHTKGEKKAVPLALKTVEKLKKYELLPFTSNHKHAEDVFRMLGMIYGDGCVDRNLNTLSFISSVKENIDLWENDFVKVFPFIKDKLSLIHVGEYGHAFCIRTCDRAVIRFFVVLGVPVGDKVIVLYSFPKKFESLSKKLILAFFDGLFAAEVSIPRFVSTKYGKSHFKNFSFSLSKHNKLEFSHKEFLTGIMNHMEKLGIQCTGFIGVQNYKNSRRKDRKKSLGYRIFFRGNSKNVQKFHKLFPLKYCVEKKQKFDGEIKKCLDELKGERN
ncbi:MAG: hypothetical protein ABIA76_03615 [Candidatus Diapherotrites archaeon]